MVKWLISPYTYKSGKSGSYNPMIRSPFDPKLQQDIHTYLFLIISNRYRAARSSETKPIVFPVPLARSKRSRAAPRRRISKIKRYAMNILFTEKWGWGMISLDLGVGWFLWICSFGNFLPSLMVCFKCQSGTSRWVHRLIAFALPSMLEIHGDLDPLFFGWLLWHDSVFSEVVNY